MTDICSQNNGHCKISSRLKHFTWLLAIRSRCFNRERIVSLKFIIANHEMPSFETIKLKVNAEQKLDSQPTIKSDIKKADAKISDLSIKAVQDRTYGSEFPYVKLNGKKYTRNANFPTFVFEIVTNPSLSIPILVNLEFAWTAKSVDERWLIWADRRNLKQNIDGNTALVILDKGRAFIHIRTHWACLVSISCECESIKRFKTVVIRSPAAQIHTSSEIAVADALLQLAASK